MKRNNYIFLIILIAISISANSQSYSINTLSIDRDLRDCENQTTIISQSDSFDINVNQIGNSPRGYITTFRGRLLDDSQDCDIDETDTINRSNISSLCDTFAESFNGCCDSFDVTFRIIPDYSILTPNPGVNNALPEITLSMTPGYDPLVYQWQYFHPTTNQWVSFPSNFIGQSSITFTAEDLFGSDAASFFNISIQYRIELCNGYVPSGFPYIYSFLLQSPEVDDVVVQNPICSYDNGGFTVNFDRPLNNGEVLTSLSLTDATNTVFDDADDVELFQSIANATYSGTQFTWPMEVPPGRYRLLYQSDGTNSLEQYDPIIIIAPPPLQYEVKIASEISCFEEEDGSVMITIDPAPTNGSIGTPPYFYTINSGTLIPFEGMNTSTIVTELGSNALEIKVFDSKGCTERIN